MAQFESSKLFVNLPSVRIPYADIADPNTRNAFIEIQKFTDSLLIQMGKAVTLVEGTIETIDIAPDATSHLQQEEYIDSVALFDGSGSDDDTWLTVMNTEFSAYGDSPITVLAQMFITVDQITDADKMQFLVNGPQMYSRLIRWTTASPPGDKYADTPSGFTEVYRPNKPVELLCPGNLPGAVVAKFEQPAAGDYTYEVQVKWKKVPYAVGTVHTHVASNAVHSDGAVAKWRSYIDPADRTTAIFGYIADYVINIPDLSVTDRVIVQVHSQSVLTVSGAALTDSSTGHAYTIDDPNLAPKVSMEYGIISVLEAKR